MLGELTGNVVDALMPLDVCVYVCAYVLSIKI